MSFKNDMSSQGIGKSTSVIKKRPVQNNAIVLISQLAYEPFSPGLMTGRFQITGFNPKYRFMTRGNFHGGSIGR
jgi:hypothetical protein